MFTYSKKYSDSIVRISNSKMDWSALFFCVILPLAILAIIIFLAILINPEILLLLVVSVPVSIVLASTGWETKFRIVDKDSIDKEDRWYHATEAAYNLYKDNVPGTLAVLDEIFELKDKQCSREFVDKYEERLLTLLVQQTHNQITPALDVLEQFS